MKIRKLFLSALMLSLSQFLFANEGGEAKKEEAAEPKNERPWIEIQSKASAFAAATKQSEEKLKDLLREKKSRPSAEKLHELEKDIKQAYKDFSRNKDELSKQKELLRYRFPEKYAEKAEREYKPVEANSLEEIEQLVGVEAKLKKNLLKMRSQYGEPAGSSVQKEKSVSAHEKASPPAHRETSHGGGKAKPAPAHRPEPESGEKSVFEQDSPILKK